MPDVAEMNRREFGSEMGKAVPMGAQSLFDFMVRLLWSQQLERRGEVVVEWSALPHRFWIKQTAIEDGRLVLRVEAHESAA